MLAENWSTAKYAKVPWTREHVPGALYRRSM